MRREDFGVISYEDMMAAFRGVLREDFGARLARQVASAKEAALCGDVDEEGCSAVFAALIFGGQ